jgi:DNA-binding NarL/FixJ family response regulator
LHEAIRHIPDGLALATYLWLVLVNHPEPLLDTPDDGSRRAEGTMAVRVVISDGSPVIRDAIRRHLECIGCDIVAEAATAEQALALFKTVRPEIVVLGADLSFGGESTPLSLVHLIKSEAPETSVLVIARAFSESDTQMFELGGALGCFVAPFEFASLWRTLSMAHPELMAGAFATMMSITVALKASRVSR